MESTKRARSVRSPEQGPDVRSVGRRCGSAMFGRGINAALIGVGLLLAAACEPSTSSRRETPARQVADQPQSEGGEDVGRPGSAQQAGSGAIDPDTCRPPNDLPADLARLLDDAANAELEDNEEQIRQAALNGLVDHLESRGSLNKSHFEGFDSHRPGQMDYVAISPSAGRVVMTLDGTAVPTRWVGRC